MSESSSIGTNSSSGLGTIQSSQSGSSDYSDISGTTVPLILVTSHRDDTTSKLGSQASFKQLPANRYCYTSWHEVRNAEVKGDQLNCPRIREGPREKERTFYSLRDEDGNPIHHDRKGKKRMDYRNKMENWENAVSVNLSFQDLGDAYQRENFIRVLKRLIRAEELQLMDDSLTDLHAVSLPRCKYLNLSRNFLPSLKKLPRLPVVEHLYLEQNNISSLDGLDVLRKAPLQSLHLRSNPVSFTVNYRQRVFQILPNLKSLDGVKRLPSDSVFDSEEEPSRMCVIC
ncbi:uncharacterized protein LOC144884522 [Branchiostoma floridae x Branchiostoma japonicum]